MLFLVKSHVSCGEFDAESFISRKMLSIKHSCGAFRGNKVELILKMFSSRIVSFVLLCGMCHLQEKSVKAQEVQITTGQECQMTPVIHVLRHPGCKPKAIPSFACVGKCTSYVQVSGSKIWQMERTCNCCQESGEREATVVLFCPKAKDEGKRFMKVSTKAPLECMCRPCGSIDESSIVPQEIAGYSEEGPLHNHFRKTL